MRYYRIEIGGDTPAVYTSWVNGRNDPGALNVEFDIPVTAFATPAGNAMVRVWGISLQTISQARDFNGAPIKVFAGMQMGLPLANPKQAGVVVTGTILQAFGNWIGTAMTLDLIIIADGGATPGNPKNIVFSWAKGTSLAAAITSTLQNAFPGFKVDIKINTALSLAADENGYFETVEQFAAYLKNMTAAIKGGTYTGVNIVLSQSVFSVYDGTTAATPVNIAFTDLIGQPTWIAPAQIQFNTVLRADLGVGDYVRLPPSIVTTTAPSQSQYRDQSAFQGVFQLGFLRHVGNFRQPNAESWVTTFNCYPAPAS